MISYSRTIRNAAMLCAILTAGLAVGQDGVVRMSDRSNKSPSDTGVVQMRAPQSAAPMRPVGYTQAGCGTESGAACGECPSGRSGCAAPQDCCGFQPQQWNGGCCGCNCGNGSGAGCGCNTGSCNGGGCNGSGYVPTDCNTVFCPGHGHNMPACWCQDCNSSPCQCRDRNGRPRRSGSNGSIGYNGGDDGTTIFAGSVDSGTGSRCRDYYHGQAMSFRNKNARLADKLFGWMVPSGCCGQGCPPVGMYHMTYADDPGYANPHDSQVYAAQGYGMPITVPMAPNVNHTYNYSSGIPASRVSPIGYYGP